MNTIYPSVTTILKHNAHLTILHLSSIIWFIIIYHLLNPPPSPFYVISIVFSRTLRTENCEKLIVINIHKLNAATSSECSSNFGIVQRQRSLVRFDSSITRKNLEIDHRDKKKEAHESIYNRMLLTRFEFQRTGRASNSKDNAERIVLEAGEIEVNRLAVDRYRR